MKKSQHNISEAEKTRVAFILNPQGAGWLGGSNYIVNLIESIMQIEKLEIVIFSANKELTNSFSKLKSAEFHQTSLVAVKSPLSILRRIFSRIFGRDFFLEFYLKWHKIDILSHYGALGSKSSVPSIVWIPDFQHKRMPSYFTNAMLVERDRRFERILKNSTTVLLSSYSAKDDLKKYFSSKKENIEVLQFVSIDTLGQARLPLAELQKKYSFEGEYFHLPNQFWAHKNHAVVIGALKIARDKGKPLLVLATGNTNDFRNPKLFSDLIAKVDQNGCIDDFRALGVIPYNDMIGLMAHASAVINPSFFEGWSTTVEEGRSLGKTVILSDIDVHREQNPAGAFYFEPSDPLQLEAIMQQIVVIGREADQNSGYSNEQSNSLRRINFSKHYHEIVNRTIARHRSK